MTDDDAIKLRGSIDQSFGYFLLAFGAWIASGPLIFFYQSFVWLQTARWPAYQVYYFLGERPVTSWLGAQKVLDWIVNLPASLVLFMSGLLVFLFTLSWIEKLEQHVRDIEYNRLKAERRAKEEAGLAARQATIRAEAPQREAELRAIARRVKAQRQQESNDPSAG